MKIEDFTFVITTFNSENTIFECLEKLPKESKKIILENSGNKNLKNSLESNFENLHCYLMNENLGFGKANNFGIKKTKTKYIFILNPDVRFEDNSFENIIEIIKNEEFSIAAPININDLPIASDKIKVKQGMLEDSNVNSMLEMTRMINATRAYESVNKALSRLDKLDEKAITMVQA